MVLVNIDVIVLSVKPLVFLVMVAGDFFFRGEIYLLLLTGFLYFLGTAGAVDEEQFYSAFEDFPKVQVG